MPPNFQNWLVRTSCTSLNWISSQRQRKKQRLRKQRQNRLTSELSDPTWVNKSKVHIYYLFSQHKTKSVHLWYLFLLAHWHFISWRVFISWWIKWEQIKQCFGLFLRRLPSFSPNHSLISLQWSAPLLLFITVNTRYQLIRLLLSPSLWRPPPSICFPASFTVTSPPYLPP